MKVRAYVHVRSSDGGRTALLAPGDEVPDWASVTNPDVLVEEPEPAPAPAPAPDPEPDEKPKPRRRASTKKAASE